MTFDEAISLHTIVIHRYGGSTEMIDRGKLESALAAPMASFDGTLLNKSIEDISAAYWHGVCQAHAFMDGNKRLSLIVTLVFLAKNGYRLDMSVSKVENVTMSIARGELTKSKLANHLIGKVVLLTS